jgi:hypothetical protein
MGEMPGVDLENGTARGFGAGEIDWIENLDWSTTVSRRARSRTSRTSEHPAGGARGRDRGPREPPLAVRALFHPRVRPAEPPASSPGVKPIFQDEDFAWMGETARNISIHGWKLYCDWGDRRGRGHRRPADERLVVRRQRHGDRRAHPEHLGQVEPGRTSSAPTRVWRSTGRSTRPSSRRATWA